MAAITVCVTVPLVVAALRNRVDASWVPPLVTAAMSPADNVRESRVEMVDPYVALWALALPLCAGLVVASSGRLRRRLGGMFATSY